MKNDKILTEQNRTEQNRTEQNRIVWMDIFRGWGIILMIMGHVGFGNKFSYFIHAFHMPMFFFISGYFFKNREVQMWGYIKRKAGTLLIPYITFGILHYVIWLVLNWKEKSFFPIKHLLFVNTEGLPIAGALWFLTALFLRR